MALQLKPHFYLFQRVCDQLYLKPPMMLEETSSKKVYFSPLSFTKPLEKLVLCTVSLQVLLDWLSKPKGPHLVEAMGGANPEKALAIAVTRQMLYEGETSGGDQACVQAPLHLHRALQCRLHASE